MKKKRLHRMNSASSSSACIKRNNRQKSAILSKLSNESGVPVTGSVHSLSQPSAVYEHIAPLSLFLLPT